MTSQKPSILAFTSYYAPGFKAGGPPVSVSNLVTQLSPEFDFHIVTRDRDLGDKIAYPSITSCTWTNVREARAYYLPPHSLNIRTLAAIMRETPHDLVYLNSALDTHFTILPLIAHRFALVAPCPTIVAPRGEFSAGALQLKAFKKRTFLGVAKAIGLYADLTWQASTELEASDIRRQMGSTAQRVAVAPNLPRPVRTTTPSARVRKPNTPLSVLFLSRISPMKNLLFAIQTLAQVRAPLIFSIYGPKEDASYWARCEEAIALLPRNIRAEYCGPVNPDQVPAILGQHDLLFLPTLGENYGHVIAESFQAGTPALISNQTPWLELEKKGVGADLPLEGLEPFKQYIENMASMSTDTLQAMRLRVTHYAEQFRADHSAIDANRELFLEPLRRNFQ